MYVQYGQLISFANTPSFNTMQEANLIKKTQRWIGEAKNDITADYWFTVTLQFSQWGVAIDSSVLVQVKQDGVWVTIGTYSPLGNILLSEVIGTFNNEQCQECVPSDTPSLPLHYYVEGYYVPDYYV